MVYFRSMVEKTTQIVHTFCGTPGTNGEGAAVPKGGMGVGLSFQQAVSSAVNKSAFLWGQSGKQLRPSASQIAQTHIISFCMLTFLYTRKSRYEKIFKKRHQEGAFKLDTPEA